MKTDFTNNITHELKTPIAVAYAANDALLNFGRSEKPVEREKYLKICQEQLRMLGGMVEQILSMSMERRRNLVLDKEEICLKPLVEAVAERQRIRADKEVSIKCVVDSESLTVMADRVHFHNVMSETVLNSFIINFMSYF